MPNSKVAAKKIVLHCPRGYQPELDTLVRQWIRDGVVFVGAVGKDCAHVEDIIDELCVGDGSNPYFMITTSHPNESIADVLECADALSGRQPGPVEVVEL